MLKADFLMTDDKQARRIAAFNDIKVIGFLGILIWAKKQTLIKEVKPSLNAIYTSNIYLSEDLYNYVLHVVNEL